MNFKKYLKIYLLLCAFHLVFAIHLSAKNQFPLILPDSFPSLVFNSDQYLVYSKVNKLDKKWKIGLSFGLLSFKSSPILHLLTEDPSKAISNEVFITFRGIPFSTSRSLYLVENYKQREGFSTYPILRLQLERSISNKLKLKTGLSVFTTATTGGNVKKAIQDTDFEHAALFNRTGNYYLFEIGTNYQFSNKKWKPYAGLSLLFNFAKTNYRGYVIYGADKNIVRNVSQKDIFTDWYFYFYAFNCEVGVNYQLFKRLEVGLDLHSIGAPFYRDFTIPLPGIQLNYLL